MSFSGHLSRSGRIPHFRDGVRDHRVSVGRHVLAAYYHPIQWVFLNLLPLGKHFHVITALPNVFLKSLGYPLYHLYPVHSSARSFR